MIFFILVEFGAVGAIGTNYPTTGFGAAYTLAHEIGKLKMINLSLCFSFETFRSFSWDET